MDRITAFLDIPRRGPRAEAAAERVHHFHEFLEAPSAAEIALQAGKAFVAASIARSTSARPPYDTLASVDSSAGLMTASELPESAAIHWPLM